MNPRFTLVKAFPPELGYRGAETNLTNLSSYKMPAWFSKVQAVHTCVQRNLDQTPVGKGKRAFRRVLGLFPARKAMCDADKVAEFTQLKGQLE